MANIVHSKNILIEFTRTTNIPGWLKELCYRTIDEGYLSKKSLKEVCHGTGWVYQEADMEKMGHHLSGRADEARG